MGHLHDKAVELVRAGNTYKQAGDALGMTRSAVAGACYRAGLKVGRREPTPEGRIAQRKKLAMRWHDPEWRAAHMKRLRQYRRDMAEIAARQA